MASLRLAAIGGSHRASGVARARSRADASRVNCSLRKSSLAHRSNSAERDALAARATRARDRRGRSSDATLGHDTSGAGATLASASSAGHSARRGVRVCDRANVSYESRHGARGVKMLAAEPARAMVRRVRWAPAGGR